MSIHSDPEEFVSELLKRLTEIIQKREADLLDKEVKEFKKSIKYLRDRLPAVKKWEEKLFDPLSKLYEDHCRTKTSDVGSIIERINQIKDSLVELHAESKNDQCVFEALSEEELRIIKDADNNPIMRCLRVSYDSLQQLDRVDLKECLLLLAIFPENAVIKKRLLIYWWIGQGLVQDEETGEKVFKELLKHELIQPHGNGKSPIVNKCHIHPWIRYMLISVATEKKILLLDQGIPLFDSQNSKRTSLIDGRKTLTGEIGYEFDKLETIFNLNRRKLELQHGLVAELKSLVVLQLGRWQDSPTHHIEVKDESVLKGLATLKHLKYLSLRGISRITSLPPSIRGLVNLKILDLKACHNLETLSAEIVYLKKLTHLDVSECYLLGSMPKGLDKLTSLRVLKGFIIGNSQKSPVKVQDLPNLKLERLSIHIGSEADMKYHQLDKLKEITTLSCLKISWGLRKDQASESSPPQQEKLNNDRKVQVPESPRSRPRQKKLNDDQKFELSLSFPAQLKELDLEGFPDKKMPGWLSPSKLGNLEKLSIKGGNLSNLDPGDKKDEWKVRYLILKYTKNLQYDKPTLKQMFPSLEFVEKV